MNDQLALIALSSVPKLRHFLNKVVIDALLYASGPIYAQTIINNVGDEINRLYTLFMEKHPNFNGSVSLAGHSLGSVIVFDLLANQMPESGLPSNSDKLSSTSSSSSSRVIADNSTVVNENTYNNNNDESNNNNINENITNQDGESKDNITMGNVRQDCLNASHHHHDIVSAADLKGCSDYGNLEELLKDMGLTQYADLFHKEHIDLNTLLLLTDLDMKELNLPFGVRRKLGTYINFKKISKMSSGLQQQQSSSSLSNTHQQPSRQSASSENIGSSNDISDKKKEIHNSNTNLFDNMNTGQYLIKYPQLKFKPRCFFAFGSPTPMFLNVRGVQDISKEYKLPTCDRMFNIFHPYDPLAYRIEPLIDPRFKGVEPVQIPHHRGGKRIHVQLREGFARVGHDIKHRLLGSLRNTWSSFARFNGTSTPNESPESSLLDGAKQQEPRKRLTKSASSSVDVEVEPFEGSINMAAKQHKRQLKRQQMVRSQSDLNVTSLDSIIEDSVRQSLDVDEDFETDHAIMMSHLEAFNLNNTESMLPPKQSSDPTSMPGSKKQHPQPTTKSKTSENLIKNSEDSAESFDPSKVGRLNGGRRLDYVLQEKPIELFNEYIFAFTSHANYWQNEDSALILLDEIYKTDGVHLFDCLD